VSRKPVLGGREVVRVAIAQVSPVYLDRERSVDRACAAIREAAAQGAELVVFPEVWLAGYPYWTEGWDSPLERWVGGRVRFRDAAVLIPSEDTERLGEAARQAGVYVVMGCNEIDPHPAVDTVYNTLLFLGPDGALLGRHRKLMPTFSERQFWGMGDARDLFVIPTELGRIGGLICGEHLMTNVRSALIAQGEDIHVAVFPGAFALHTGPRLEEWDTTGAFWGHASVRAHALEAGAFVLSACGFLDDADVPADLPQGEGMNTSYARGGSSVIAPLGVPLVEPVEGSQIIHAELHAWMKKAWNAIIDTAGHYARPDVVRLQVRGEAGWAPAEQVRALDRGLAAAPAYALAQAAEAHGVEPVAVEAMAERALLSPGAQP
jgi:predicted amidohydrolase